VTTEHVLLLTSHSIAEYDDHRMLSDAGYDVFSIGAYTNPGQPGDDKRPALPYPAHPELEAACIRQREAHAGEDDSYVIDWAKADLAPEVIDWADVIIVHHYLGPWVIDQWPRIRHKRVVWRTCGQSNPQLERAMTPLHRDGLQIVRYSPREKPFFEAAGTYAGEDALIRFGKYPDDYGPWEGDDPVIGNVSQWRGGSDPLGRGDALGLGFWLEATRDLPTRPAGPGSEALRGGLGELTYPAMLEYLRHISVYLYTGTAPASYTLGLIEAMMTGVPVVSIGPLAWPGPSGLFEAHKFVGTWHFSDAPWSLREALTAHLAGGSPAHWAEDESRRIRKRAIQLFGIETVTAQWLDFLGAPVREAVPA
jgi:hypothetical protein